MLRRLHRVWLAPALCALALACEVESATDTGSPFAGHWSGTLYFQSAVADRPNAIGGVSMTVSSTGVLSGGLSGWSYSGDPLKGQVADDGNFELQWANPPSPSDVTTGRFARVGPQLTVTGTHYIQGRTIGTVRFELNLR